MKDVIVKNVPDKLHLKFKTFCVMNEISISACLRNYMENISTERTATDKSITTIKEKRAAK